jgi:hypothetical protein
MINAIGDIRLRGKGEAAENKYVARAYLFGRDDNIGATVTPWSVALFDIGSQDHSTDGAVIFCLSISKKGEK